MSRDSILLHIERYGNTIYVGDDIEDVIKYLKCNGYNCTYRLVEEKNEKEFCNKQGKWLKSFYVIER